MKKRILAILLSLALCLSLLPTAFAADIETVDPAEEEITLTEETVDPAEEKVTRTGELVSPAGAAPVSVPAWASARPASLAGEQNGVSASGKCGDNLNWNLSAQGVLTISGTGAMWDFSETGPQWFAYSDSIQSVVINSGATSISAFAFIECVNMTGVTIPATVKSIGKCAFYDCMNLPRVVIPNGVTAIEEATFYNCLSLESVTIPASVKSIGEAAFYDCISLTGVTIPSSVTSIGNYAFYECVSLTGLTIPGSVQTVGNNAFCSCISLESLTISEGVKNIYEFAFFGCVSLTGVTLPATLTVLGSGAFSMCSSLTAFTVAGGNTKLCSVDGVLFSSDRTVLKCCPAGKNVGDYVIPYGVVYVQGNAFSGCSQLTGVTIPASVKVIYNLAFDYCSGLTAFRVAEANPQYKSIDGVLFNKKASHLECYPGGRSGSYAVPSGVQTILGYAFSECQKLTAVSFPETLTAIGEGAFIDCTGLTSIVFPSGLNNINEAAFAYCENLSRISFTGPAPGIYPNSFYGVSAVATYPPDDNSWTPDKRQNYGGSIIWEPYELAIMVPPQDYTGLSGERARFTVEAKGDELKYQWQVYSGGKWSNTDWRGYNTETLQPLISSANDGAKYRCVVTDRNGDSVTSNAATLHMYKLEITAQPKDYAGQSGTRASFPLTVRGDGLKYQWQTYAGGAWKNTDWSGYNTATLRPLISSANNGSRYRCVITDKYGSSVTSSAATLRIYKLEITAQPKDYTGASGTRASFTVTARGDGLKYQWQTYSGGAWKNTDWSGYSTATLRPLISSANNGSRYRCVITDKYGSSVTSNAATLRIYKLEITAQPKDYAGQSGTRASFTVTARGDGLKYQWQTYSGGVWKNTDWSGYNTATLRPLISSTNNGAKYRCVITDQYGSSVTSSAATLRIYKLEITAQPKDYTGASGTRASFTVTVRGDGLSYQWQTYSGGAWKNTDWSGYSTATLRPLISSANDGAKYRCVITDQYGSSVTSEAATLHLAS